MEGQSLEVDSESVIGIFEETKTLTWTVIKFLETDVIESATLFLVGDTGSQKLLFRGIANPLQKEPDAENVFGERIAATWSGLTYNLELKNLQYNDTVSFTLLVVQTAKDFLTPRNRTLKTITITNVVGMYIGFDALYYKTGIV